MAAILFLFLASLLRDGSCTYSLFFGQQPQQYEIGQQQHGQPPKHLPNYWTDNGQEYEEDPGYRYHQTYQSTYRQQIQSIPSYPNTVYQQLPPAGLPSYQGEGDGRMPVYQLVTIGPEVPVLVRLPNQQTAILPVRTVYSLPGFLERIVQRVQNYYSVYNPLDTLKAPKKNITAQVDDVVTITATSIGSGDSSSETTAPPQNHAEQSTKLSTLNVTEVTPAQETTTEQTADEEESSTTESSANNAVENTTKE